MEQREKGVGIMINLLISGYEVVVLAGMMGQREEEETLQVNVLVN